jgi:hypothetical protein
MGLLAGTPLWDNARDVETMTRSGRACLSGDPGMDKYGEGLK